MEKNLDFDIALEKVSTHHLGLCIIYIEILNS